MSDQRVINMVSRSDDTSGALEVLAKLREEIEAGRVVAFCAVAIEPGDETTRWQASTRPVTKLRMLGAVASLAHWIHEDD